MSKTVTLYTTVKDFELLHAAIESHRANAREVKVPRQVLMNLLLDHSKMCKELKID